MKEKIHPKLYETNVKCACGNTFQSLSTREELRVEICSECHPFYTGKQQAFTGGKEGRVEKFRRRFNLESNKIEV
jgi:large subunit ribosomal protein L31